MHKSDEDIARDMFERAMEDVHHHVNIAKEAVEEMSILIDGLNDKPTEEERQKAEELVVKALISLCNV